MSRQDEINIVCNKLLEFDLRFEYRGQSVVSPITITVLGGGRVKDFLVWLLAEDGPVRTPLINITNNGLELTF